MRGAPRCTDITALLTFSLVGTARDIAALPPCPCAPEMEDVMCYSRDDKIFEDQQKKAQEQANQQRRSGVIDKLLGEANKQGDKAKEMPVKDVAPAK